MVGVTAPSPEEEEAWIRERGLSASFRAAPYSRPAKIPGRKTFWSELEKAEV